ncbi:rhodanese-like domain-containing protein [Megalodesulfovibrio paquesii]
MRLARLVVAAAMLLCWAVPAGADLVKKEMDLETKAVNLVRETQRGGYTLVTTEELQKKLAEVKDLLVVDTMPLVDSYEKNHIPGARQFLFPIEEMAEWDPSKTDGKTLEQFKALLGPDLNRPIVFYCGFVKCTRSHNGALWAVKLGYKHVSRHPGGITAWLEAEYPVETGK